MGGFGDKVRDKVCSPATDVRRRRALSLRGCESLRVCVEGFWCDVSVVWPDDRSRFCVGAQLLKETEIPKRPENTAVLEEIRKVNIRGSAILEPDVHDIALNRGCLDQLWGASHGPMVNPLRQRIDLLKRLVTTCSIPIVTKRVLVGPGPFIDQPPRTGRELARDHGKALDVDRGLVTFRPPPRGS